MRRKPYTKLAKANQVRADHVKGASDVAYRGFQCLNPNCVEHIFAREPLPKEFQIVCPKCGFVHESGGASKFFDYELNELHPVTKEPIETIEYGEFEVLHDEYINEAIRYKYCIICSALKPLELFDAHGARETGKQGECNLCKKLYNSIKNQTRLADQHREAAQKRRLYLELSKEKRIDSKAIFLRFEHKCFQCEKPLIDSDGKPLQGQFHIDHTLPAMYLWPATTETATLLCDEHNNEKKGHWPGEYYDERRLRKLVVLTGLDYELLKGPPTINPDALGLLKNQHAVREMFTKYAKYRADLIVLRNRVLRVAGLDIFQVAGNIANSWIGEADARLKK